MLSASLALGADDLRLRAKPVTGPMRVEFSDYSVLAPEGQGWFELLRDERRVIFGKRVVSPTHAMIATATAELHGQKFDGPEAFRAYLAMNPLDAREKRNVVLEHDVQLDASVGASCARIYTLAEDRDAVHARGAALLLETFGVSCLHPEKPATIIHVSYSERGLASEASVELRHEGEQFVRSLTFVGGQPLNRAAPSLRRGAAPNTN
jgi:hypothetical protein